MSSWTIYLITRLEYIRIMVGVLLAIGFIGFIMAAWLWGCAFIDGDVKLRVTTKYLCLKILLPVTIIFAILLSAIPDTKEIVAIYLIPKIVNNEQVLKLPNTILEFLDSELLSRIKESIPNTAEQTTDSYNQ